MARTSAERKSEERRRAAANLTLFRVEAPRGPLADLLVDAGFLKEWDSENVDAVAEALSRMIQLSLLSTEDVTS